MNGTLCCLRPTKTRQYISNDTWTPHATQTRPNKKHAACCNRVSAAVYLLAERRAYGGVAVLSEAHLKGNVQGHGVLFLRERLDDGDRLMHSFVRTGKEKIGQQGV